MAGTALLTAQIEEGATLVRELDKFGMSPETAAWVYLIDRDRWKLILQFDAAYEKVPAISEVAGVMVARRDIFREISMGDITVARPTDQIIGALKAMIHTGHGVNFVKFGPTSANGVYIDAGLAYRALDPVIAAAE